MASRPASSGGRRLLIVALVITIVVVLIDASLKARNPAPAETLSGQAWVDKVLPIITASSAEGQELDKLRTSGIGMSGAALSSALTAIASGAARSSAQVQALGQPVGTGGAPGLLEACLQVRAQAAKAMVDALDAVLTGQAPTSPSDPNVMALVAAGQDMGVADRAYQLFTADLPKTLSVTMPASVWVPDPTVWQAAGLQAYLTALRNGTSLTPVYQVAIQAVSTNPPPVGAAGGLQQLAPTRTMTVSIVVADTGNQPAADLTVTAAVAPATANEPGQVRDFVSLQPGDSYATTIGPIWPAPGVNATLTVTVAAPHGSAIPTVTRAIPIVVAAPPPPTTTTTPPTTTAAG